MNLPDSKEPIHNEEPVNDWFELSYASYLTLPRSLLEAMPVPWQERLVLLLTELEAEFPVSWPPEGKYRVSLVAPSGRFMKDALAEYRRPDTFLIESLRQRRRSGYLGNINGPGCDPDTL